MTPDEGKAIFHIVPWDRMSGDRAPVIKVQAHYIHEAAPRTGSWPDRSWVKSVGGTYQLIQPDELSTPEALGQEFEPTGG